VHILLDFATHASARLASPEADPLFDCAAPSCAPCSHNPAEHILLDITDRLGVLVLDENRVLATLDNCGVGCEDVPPYGGDVAAEAGALAARDRTHASVAYFSICNEFGCGPASLLANNTALSVIESIDAADGSRAITGNMGWQGKSATAPHTPLSDIFTLMASTGSMFLSPCHLEINFAVLFLSRLQGMSHQSAETLESWHAQEPDKLVVMSECCSCETQASALVGESAICSAQP
jgi:hypothetical protein